MSDEVLALILTVATLVFLFLWVPTLDICNDRCQRLLGRRSRPAAELPAPEIVTVPEIVAVQHA